MESEEQRREEEEVAVISGGSVWSASTTRILISYYKENPILWEKRLREHGNKTKTKKTMAPFIARFEKANPPRSAQDLMAKWHSPDMIHTKTLSFHLQSWKYMGTGIWGLLDQNPFSVYSTNVIQLEYSI